LTSLSIIHYEIRMLLGNEIFFSAWNNYFQFISKKDKQLWKQNYYPNLIRPIYRFPVLLFPDFVLKKILQLVNFLTNRLQSL
jgi:hypothetical protein